MSSCCGKKMVPTDPASEDNAWMGSGLGTSGIGLQYENEDSTGIPVLRNRANNRTLEVSSEFVTTSLWKFATLSAALTQAAVLAPSSTSPLRITLHPGVHTLAASASVPTYTLIEGQDRNSTILSYSAAGSTLVIGKNSTVRNLWLAGNTTASIALTMSTASQSTLIQNCYFTGFTDTAISTSNTGSVYVDGCDFTNPISFPTAIKSSSTTTIYVNSCQFISNYYGVYLNGSGASTLYARGNRFVSMQNCILTNAQIATCYITDCLFSSSVAEDINFGNAAHVVYVTGCTTQNGSSHGSVGCTSTSATVHVSACNFSWRSIDNNIAAAGSRRLYNLNWNENDRVAGAGTHVVGSLTVGMKDEGSQFYTCQGSNNQLNTVCDTYNTSDVFQASNIAAHRQNASSGTLSIPSLAVGTLGYEVIGDSAPFYGLIYTVTTAGSVTTGCHAVQYLGSGGVWTDLKFTVFLNSSGGPCRNVSSGTNIFPENTTGEYVMLFSTSLQSSALSPAWTSQAFGSSGTKYFIRIRKVATIATTAPVVHYLNTITSTSWFNSLGRCISFGKCRQWKTMCLTWANMLNSIASVVPYNVYAGDTIHVPQGVSNKIAAADYGGQFFFMPPDMDPSSPVKIAIAFISTNSGASQAAFTLDWTVANLKSGTPTITDGAGAALSNQQTSTMTCTPNATDGRIMTNAEITVSDVLTNPRNNLGSATDLWGVYWTRTASGNANTMVILGFEMRYIACIDGNAAT